nr:PorV/PorQ family protein [candidate division Zixibacteria bacterium]
MKKLKNSTIFILLILGYLPVLAAEGGYNGVFLKVPVDARATGMGGAHIAVSNDGYSQLHNPAGLQTITANNFASSYRAMKLGRKLGYLSIGFPTRLESALAFSWLYTGYGEVERRDNSGFLTGSTISSEEHVFGLTFAKRFIPWLGLGTKLSYLHKSIGDIKANSVGFNLGAILYVDSLSGYEAGYTKYLSDLTLGLVISNLAGRYKWDSNTEGLGATKTDDFPIDIGLGLAGRILQGKLLLAADMDILLKRMDYPVDDGETQTTDRETVSEAVFQFGGEYELNDKLTLRTGLDDGTFTAGAGFNFAFEKTFLSINYAFSNDRVGEGDDHIFSFGLIF